MSPQASASPACSPPAASPTSTPAVHDSPSGYVVIDNCTGFAGSVSYSPGLRTTVLRSTHAVLTGTTSGCSDIFNGPESGTRHHHGRADRQGQRELRELQWHVPINWPASSGFNPSQGTLSVTESGGLETISGEVAGGFDTGTVLGGQYVVTGKTGKGTKLHPVTKRAYTTPRPSPSQRRGLARHRLPAAPVHCRTLPHSGRVRACGR